MSTARPNGVSVQRRQRPPHVDERLEHAGRGQGDDAPQRHRREAQRARPRAGACARAVRGGASPRARRTAARRARRSRRSSRRTWTTSSGNRATTGLWVVACPARAGVIARNATGIASAARTPAPGNGAGATPSAPTAAGRRTGIVRAPTPAARTVPSTSQSRTRRPQMRPKRVPRTSRTTLGSRADQKLVPPAVAPCSTMPAAPETTPRTTATASIRRARAANAVDASGQPPPAPAALTSAGRQLSRRNARPPRSSAIAR